MNKLFEKRNYLGLVVGLILLAAGYACLMQKPATNPIALNVAPILLVLGYGVAIPFGIMLGGGRDKE